MQLFEQLLTHKKHNYSPFILGTPESESFLWNSDYVCLELTHNHGSENDPKFTVNNGNAEPYR